MNDFEARSARRRAELEWQELERRGAAQKAAASGLESRAKESARLLVDRKTQHLRALRLARQRADLESKAAAKRPQKRRAKTAQAADAS